MHKQEFKINLISIFYLSGSLTGSENLSQNTSVWNRNLGLFFRFEDGMRQIIFWIIINFMVLNSILMNAILKCNFLMLNI